MSHEKILMKGLRLLNFNEKGAFFLERQKIKRKKHKTDRDLYISLLKDGPWQIWVVTYGSWENQDLKTMEKKIKKMKKWEKKCPGLDEPALQLLSILSFFLSRK